MITPTTKAVDHDVPISPADIVAQGLMSQVCCTERRQGGHGGALGNPALRRGHVERTPRCPVGSGPPPDLPACPSHSGTMHVSLPCPTLQADWDAVSAAALALFAFGQDQAARRGLLLVDTKYEFGKDTEGG